MYKATDQDTDKEINTIGSHPTPPPTHTHPRTITYAFKQTPTHTTHNNTLAHNMHSLSSPHPRINLQEHHSYRNTWESRRFDAYRIRRVGRCYQILFHLLPSCSEACAAVVAHRHDSPCHFGPCHLGKQSTLTQHSRVTVLFVGVFEGLILSTPS
jgi:hypothetical protein